MLEPLAPLAAKAEEARSALSKGARVVIEAQPGSGQAILLDQLTGLLGRQATVRVDVPPFDDVDAPLHALLQAAAQLGAEDVHAATQDSEPLRDRARTIAQSLAKHQKVLLLWLPYARLPPRDTDDPGAQIRYRRAEDLLGGWLSIEALKIVILLGSDAIIKQTTGEGLEQWQRVSLEVPRFTAEEIGNSSWGTFDQYAKKLRDALHRRRNPLTLTPVQTRLLVGLVALGESPAVLLNNMAPHGHAQLEKLLCESLKQDRALRDGALRIAQARAPIPREVALQLSRIPEQYAPLVTECIGDGGDMFRAPESLRSALNRLRKGPADAGVQAKAHIAIADYHQSLDGAPSPGGALFGMVHWLEKVHHLGQSGPAGKARWTALDLPNRELYWDRARSLSVDHRDFLGAAELYRECIRRFDPGDAYAWHYLGFNLDRAGAERTEAERAFRKAVALRPDHPWYNGRLVTFLIEQARFRDADQAWQEALERVDPTGEGVLQAPWLFDEFYRWIVKAWLRMGEVRRARAAFDTIPWHMLDQRTKLEDLREELEDAEEAVALGESVYPSSTPMSDRWVQPADVVPNQSQDGLSLKAWFPGRVSSVDEEGVHLALAVPDPEPEKRRLIVRTLSPKEWTQLGFCSMAEAAERFVFVAIYQDDRGEVARIHPVPDSARRRAPDEADPLRYFRKPSA